MSNSAAETLLARTFVAQVGATTFHEARTDAIVAHCQHFGLHDESPSFMELARTGLRRTLMADHLFINGISVLSPQSRLYNSTHDLTYTVQIEYEPESIRTRFPNSLTLPIPLDSLAHPWAPIECTELDCPVKEYHYRGLYMHYGRPSSEMSRFGFSDPPPEVWHALERVQDRLPEADDQKIVDRFADYHTWLCTRAGETGIEEEEQEQQENETAQ